MTTSILAFYYKAISVLLSRVVPPFWRKRPKFGLFTPSRAFECTGAHLNDYAPEVYESTSGAFFFAIDCATAKTRIPRAHPALLQWLCCLVGQLSPTWAYQKAKCAPLFFKIVAAAARCRWRSTDGALYSRPEEHSGGPEHPRYMDSACGTSAPDPNCDSGVLVDLCHANRGARHWFEFHPSSGPYDSSNKETITWQHTRKSKI